MKISIEVTDRIVSSTVDQELQDNTTLSLMIAELELVKAQLLERLDNCEPLLEVE